MPFATCDARKNRSCVVRLSYNRRTFTRIAAVVHAPCEICKLIETDVLYWTYASKSICVPDFFEKREACVYTELKVSYIVKKNMSVQELDDIEDHDAMIAALVNR